MNQVVRLTKKEKSKEKISEELDTFLEILAKGIVSNTLSYNGQINQNQN